MYVWLRLCWLFRRSSLWSLLLLVGVRRRILIGVLRLRLCVRCLLVLFLVRVLCRRVVNV